MSNLPHSIILLGAALLISHGAIAKDAQSAPGHAKVESGDFGIYNPASHNVSPTRKVKFKIGDHYGWRFKVNTDQPTVSWKEEFRLPVAPKSWGDLEKGQTVVQNGKTCITKKNEPPNDGYIEHTWPELEGDPLGKYLMNVYVDGKLARRFEFTVQ